jgi:hypothetical protein
MKLDFYPQLQNPAFFTQPQIARRWPTPPQSGGFEYYTCSFADSEGTALSKIREEWLACVSTVADSLSEPVADSIQINGTAGATNFNFWVPRLLSGANNVPQFSEIEFLLGTSTAGAVCRPSLGVLCSGDPVTPAVAFQGYTWETAEETPAMRIMKITSATASSTLATVAAAATIGAVYRIEADFDGADVNLRVLENEVEILTATDVGGIQVGLPSVGRRVLANTRVFRFKNYRGGILARA